MYFGECVKFKTNKCVITCHMFIIAHKYLKIFDTDKSKVDETKIKRQNFNLLGHLNDNLCKKTFFDVTNRVRLNVNRNNFFLVITFH